MTEATLQALLDPNSNGRGIQILRRLNAGLQTQYYVTSGVSLSGRSGWVGVATADTDLQKARAIRTAIAPEVYPWTPANDSTLAGWWDSRDPAAGALATWASRDDTGHAVTQGTGSAQPTIGTGLVFDGGDSLSRAALPVVFLEAFQLPDGATASGGHGITCTGITRAPDLTWYIGNHGKQLDSDSVWAPSIMHLSADFSTLLGEILLAPLYANIESVQGVQYDRSDNTLWFADVNNQKIRHITTSGVPLPDDISLSFDPNGIGLDHTDDAMWVAQESSQGDTVAKYSCATGAEISSTTITGLTLRDHFCYDDASRMLLLSFGASGQAGLVRLYSAPADALILNGANITLSSEADAVEGIYLDGDTLYVCNDGYFHSGSPAKNRVLVYRVPPMAANIMDIWGVVKVPATTGTDAIFTIGDPLANASVGMGLYTAGATDLRLFAHSGGTGTTTQVSTTAVVPSMASAFRIFYGRIDSANDTITLWMDGTQVSTASAAAFVGAISGTGILRIGNAADVRPPTMTLLSIGINFGAGSREKIESYNGHAFGLNLNLPTSNPYRLNPPPL